MNEGAKEENERMWRSRVLDKLDRISQLLGPSQPDAPAPAALPKLGPPIPEGIPWSEVKAALRSAIRGIETAQNGGGCFFSVNEHLGNAIEQIEWAGLAVAGGEREVTE